MGQSIRRRLCKTNVVRQKKKHGHIMILSAKSPRTFFQMIPTQAMIIVIGMGCCNEMTELPNYMSGPFLPSINGVKHEWSHCSVIKDWPHGIVCVCVCVCVCLYFHLYIWAYMYNKSHHHCQIVNLWHNNTNSNIHSWQKKVLTSRDDVSFCDYFYFISPRGLRTGCLV